MIDQRNVEMMVAREAPPFTRDGWIFEFKYDGYRTLASKTAAGVQLLSRNRTDMTKWFPEIAAALAALPGEFILDAETCVPGKNGVPDFERLQNRPARRGWKRGDDLATLYAFDLIAHGKADLRKLPVVKRKERLSKLIPSGQPVGYIDYIEHEGKLLYAEAVKMGMEGTVAKRAASAYVGGLSSDWLKSKPSGHHDGWERPRRVAKAGG